jgi:hypothetical protein
MRGFCPDIQYDNEPIPLRMVANGGCNPHFGGSYPVVAPLAVTVQEQNQLPAFVLRPFLRHLDDVFVVRAIYGKGAIEKASLLRP